MSGAGTGTLATPPHQVTGQDLIDTIQVALDDAAASTFSEAELLSWINEAVREYTQHFPRISEIDLTAVALTRSYAMPWDTRRVLAVEYPADDDPPQYLTQMKRKRPNFSNDQHYDFLARHDLTTAPTLLLSFDPAAAESIRVTYQHEHDSELTATSYITVPADHHHILIQYVLFAATRQLQANEEAAPTSSSSLLMSQFASNTRRYELAYLNAINRVLYHRQGQSNMTAWKMDNHDRIY